MSLYGTFGFDNRRDDDCRDRELVADYTTYVALIELNVIECDRDLEADEQELQRSLKLDRPAAKDAVNSWPGELTMHHRLIWRSFCAGWVLVFAAALYGRE